MARIPRTTNIIFANGAGAIPGGIGVFGSLAAGTPIESINLATIMAAAQWADGWGGALVNNFPAQEDLNSVPFVLSTQIGEILQDGIPPYDAGTTYYQYSFCQYQGTLYQSSGSAANIGNTPAAGSAYWTPYGSLPSVFQNELSPAGLTGSVNDYLTGVSGWTPNIFNIILTSNGAYNITGLKFQQNGQIVNLTNNSTSIITLKNNSSSSLAANRFQFNSGDIAMPAGSAFGDYPSCVQLYYSGTLGCWLCLSGNFSV